MQSIPPHFNFQIILQQLHLNLHLTPFKLKILLKFNNSTLQTKPIQIKQKVNALSQTLSFDGQLPFKKSRQKATRVFIQKIAVIKLIGNKVKENFQIGQCKINLSQFANKNSFYYQNQIKVPIGNCQDHNAHLLLTLKLNRMEYNIEEQKSNLAFSIPNLPSLGSLRNKKILAVSRLIDIEDISSSNKTGKTYRSNKSIYTNRTYPQDQQQPQQQRTNNYHLASKLQSLYNKLQSIVSLTPSRINGIEIIKQQPSQLIQSSVISSKNMDMKYKQIEFKQEDIEHRYQDLVNHLGNMSQLGNVFNFNEIISQDDSEKYYDAKSR